MRKIERLRKEATESAELRGHTLGRWEHFDDNALAKCINPGCGACAQIIPRPMPNDIEIGGTAVALDCPVSYFDLATSHLSEVPVTDEQGGDS